MPEDLSKFFEPMLDPLLAVEPSLAAKAGPPDAATHAVIPTSYGGVDKVGTRDRQGWISWDDAYRLTTLMTRVHLVALGTGEHHQRCLSSLCGPWATIWFPASRQAQPYRKLYDRSPAVRCRDGLHPAENVAAASCRSRSGEGEVMPSPSARAANQRSWASAAGRGVDGELGCRWQAVASGGGSRHNLTPLVGRGAGGERTVARVGSPFRCRRRLVGRMGVKRPETGSKRRFLGEYATWPITAQLLFENRVMSRVAVHPSPERNRRNLIEHINLRRKHGAANFGKSRKT